MASKNKQFIASTMLAIFFVYSATVFLWKAFHFRPWDYSINWMAAMALRDGKPFYDMAVMRDLAATYIAANSRGIFTGSYNSFIGLPTTAMLHLPFTFLDFEQSVPVYRLLCLVAMSLAVFLAGLTLPVALRVRSWLVGTLFVLWWHAPLFSLQLGQVDAWVMLSLAIALFAISREQWKLAGAGIGIAALLKISPLLLIVYCALKKQWQLVLSALLVCVAGLLLSWLPQHGEALHQFFQTVLPALGDSTRQVQNQSLGAFCARLFTADVNLLDFSKPVGAWKFAGFLCVAAMLLALHWRNRVLQAGDVAIVILLALLAGPISWDHYLSWAILPVMLFAANLSADTTAGRHRRVLLLLLLLLPMFFPVYYVRPELVANNGWWRCVTGLQMLSLLATAVWMIIRANRIDGRQMKSTGPACIIAAHPHPDQTLP
ncbi:MAG TPA: glycosyltransferase family 87 protein [Pseudomonadales bacterium]|nr:glycosyltransferase family 87 protein [Pseudomonadales bacterium]